MNDEGQTIEQKDEIAKIEAIYDETMTKIKALEEEQKKIVFGYIRKLEQEKIEYIRKSLLN